MFGELVECLVRLAVVAAFTGPAFDTVALLFKAASDCARGAQYLSLDEDDRRSARKQHLAETAKQLAVDFADVGLPVSGLGVVVTRM